LVPHEWWIRVVVDPHDDPDLSDELDRRSDLGAGVVVVRPVPGVETAGQLAIDLLLALGKHCDALAWECPAHGRWELIRLWLRAEQVRTLVVLDADRLPPPLWTLLARLSLELRLGLWLVVRAAVPHERIEMLGGGRRWTVAELLHHLPLVPAHTDVSVDDRVPLPDDSFLTFRAACSEVLPREQFAKADAVYRRAFWATHTWYRRARPTRSRTVVARQLRAVVTSSTSAAETLVRLRGAQAAHFLEGFLVDAMTVTWPPLVDVPHVGLSRTVARRLRRLVTPTWVCALALAAAGVAEAGDLAALTLGDLNSDGREVVIGGRWFDVPGYAAGLLRAQILARRDAGAGSSDPLLVDGQGMPCRPHHIRKGMERATQHGVVWWPDQRRWPLRNDYPTAGHHIHVSDLASPGTWPAPSACAASMESSDPSTVEPAVAAVVFSALSGRDRADGCWDADLAAAEDGGLVRWCRGRLQPTPWVDFSLVRAEILPTLRVAAGGY
jgi:hypothetical protein